jgi:hypothetical protein
MRLASTFPLDAHPRGRAVIPVVLTLVLLAIFFVGARPTFTWRDIDTEDAADYAFAAVSLLQGQFVVSWTGVTRETNFTPGFPALLVPAVALGGIDAAAWVPYLSALFLGGLIALIAAEISVPLAAPVAVATVLFSRDIVTHAQVVLSDLPTATIAVLQLALILVGARTRGWVPIALAGVCAGLLPWLRPATILFLAAGVAGLSALPGWRRKVLVYLTASAPLLALLGIWQWSQFGSPLVTAYQAHGASSDNSGAISALFNPKYVFGQTVHAGPLSNGLQYPLHLLGLDGSSLVPGLGALGVVMAGVWTPRVDTNGLVARFSLTVLGVTLATYLPYWWQDTRFLMTPTILVGLCGAAALSQFLLQLARSTRGERSGGSIPYSR